MESYNTTLADFGQRNKGDAKRLTAGDEGYRAMIVQSSDTNPQAERVQIGLIREASVARRISTVRSLSQTAIYLSRRAIRRAKPLLTEREADLAFVANHYGEDLAERLALYLERKQL